MTQHHPFLWRNVIDKCLFNVWVLSSRDHPKRGTTRSVYINGNRWLVKRIPLQPPQLFFDQRRANAVVLQFVELSGETFDNHTCRLNNKTRFLPTKGPLK